MNQAKSLNVPRFQASLHQRRACSAETVPADDWASEVVRRPYNVARSISSALVNESVLLGEVQHNPDDLSSKHYNHSDDRHPRIKANEFRLLLEHGKETERLD